MYVKYEVFIIGDELNPELILDSLNTSLVAEMYNKRGDLLDDNGEIASFCWLALKQKNNFSKEFPDKEYEYEFLDFFVNNYDFLVSRGAQEFNILMSIYYSNQCNFEIFDKDSLKILSKYDISFPVSVYRVDDEDPPVRY